MELIKFYYNRLKNHHPTLDKAQKYVAIARYSYFLSCVGLATVVWKAHTEYKRKQEEGQEFEDTSSAHRRLRERGVEHGTIYSFQLDKGFVKEEFNRDIYLRELEKKAIRKAEEARMNASIESEELIKVTNNSSQ